MFTIDTNILIYSADLLDPRKQNIAASIVETLMRTGSQVPLQTLTEFYFAVTRKAIVTPKVASLVISKLMSACPTIAAEAEDLTTALPLNQHDKVPFFDALILATAARSGCTTFFSEDLQHNRAYGSITVRNPFLLSSAELDSLLQ